jgi:hypothetical protein
MFVALSEDRFPPYNHGFKNRLKSEKSVRSGLILSAFRKPTGSIWNFQKIEFFEIKILKKNYCQNRIKKFIILRPGKIEEGVASVKIGKNWPVPFNPRAQWPYPLPPLPLPHPLPSHAASHFSIYGLVHQQSIFGANRSVNRPSRLVFGLIQLIFSKWGPVITSGHA